MTSAGLVAAYAVKHNPFASFRSVQEGWNPENSLLNVGGFNGPRGLYADLLAFAAWLSPTFPYPQC